MLWWMQYLAIFATALVVTLLATPVARRFAILVDAVDYPGARRINREPVPRMGGIAVFLGLACAILVQNIGSRVFRWPTVLVPNPHLSVNYWRLFAAFVVIFATGLIDDKFQLRALYKLAGQILGAVLAVSGGLIIGDVVNPFAPGFIELHWLAYPVTIVYLVAYVNIFNLIDGLDGLASGVTVIAGTTMFLLSEAAGRLDAAVLSAALVGASLGFLRYNFNPASIFLGDSGSLTLGFTFGTISLLSVTRTAALTTIIVPLVVAGIPIIDTFSAIVRRRRAHVSVGQPDKGHIHHRLIEEGYNQRQTVLLIYAWTMLLCVGAFTMTKVTVWPRLFIFLVLLFASVMFARHLKLFRPVLLHYTNPDTGDDMLITPADPVFEEEAKAQITTLDDIIERHLPIVVGEKYDSSDLGAVIPSKESDPCTEHPTDVPPTPGSSDGEKGSPKGVE